MDVRGHRGTAPPAAPGSIPAALEATTTAATSTNAMQRPPPTFRRPTAFLLPLAFAGVTAAYGAAQGVTGLPMNSVDLSYPASAGVTGAAQAVVVGQLTPDAVHDAVIQHGSGQLFFHYAVDRRNTWLAVAGTHRYPALLPGALGNGRDGILTIGPGGLQKVVWSSVPGVGNLVSTPVAGTGDWIGATDLQVVEDAAGYQVLALDVGGNVVLRASWNSESGLISPSGAVLLAEPSNKLRAFHWDDEESTLELAAASPLGLRVYGMLPLVPFESDAELLYSFLESNTSSWIGVVPATAADPVERVAWIRSGAGVPDALHVFDEGGEVGSRIDFANLLIRQVTIPRLDAGDSRANLLVLSEGFPYAIGLRRSAVHGGFTSDNPFLINLDEGRSAIANSLLTFYDYPSGSGSYGPAYAAGPAPVPACADLDGDGDDDVLLAGHPGYGNKAIVYFGTLVNEESIDYESCTRAWLPSYSANYSDANHGLTLTFDEPPEKPTEGPAKLATHVRIAVWTQDDAAGSTMNSQADAVVVEPINAWSTWTHGPPAVALNGVFAGGAKGLVQIEVSFLRLAPANGAMIAAFPAYHETIDVSDLSPNVPTVFVDRARATDGVTPGGTPNRPPITPPQGGSNPPSTP